MLTVTEVEKSAPKKVRVVKVKMEPVEAIYPRIYGEYVNRIEKKAYELYEKRGCQDGHDVDDWLEAQKLVEAEMIGMD